jgi:hypothetical protein
LKALWFLVVFIAVAVTVTIAALTAFFIFWSYVPAQPGTATALAMLFLVAPGVGIASGLFVAFRAVRPASGAPGWPFALLAALTGGLAGFGGATAAMDLTYADRFSNPGSAPSWLPMAPPVAAVVMAALSAMLVLLYARRTLTAP